MKYNNLKPKIMKPQTTLFKINSIIDDCKQAIENNYFRTLRFAEMQRIENNNEFKDMPLIRQSINDFLDSLIKDLPLWLNDNAKNYIADILTDYSIEYHNKK